VRAGREQPPRVVPLGSDAASRAAAEAGVVRPLAELEVFGVLLHRPPVARAVQDLLLSMLGRGRLDPRLRELAIMRIGWVTGSVYEWTQHWRIARDVGVPEADLLALRADWRAHDGFAAADRAVLGATDDVLATGAVGDAAWAAVEAALPDDAARVELAVVIATWRMVATLLQTLRVPLEAGVAPWPPDGRSPGGPSGG
jgi:alkylhydroperoxidase family enzyme